MARNLLGQVHDRHALKRDVARSGQGCKKKALAAEQDIAEATHHLDVEADRRVHHPDMAGMDQQLLARCEIAFDHFPGQVEEHQAGPSDFLQYEPLAAEHAGAEALLPRDVQRNGFFADQEGFLPADHGLTGRELDWHDGAGKPRREGDVTRTACRKVSNEKTAAAETARKPGEEPAAGVRAHVDRVGHPAHAVGQAEHALALLEVDGDGLHDRTGDLVLHDVPCP